MDAQPKGVVKAEVIAVTVGIAMVEREPQPDTEAESEPDPGSPGGVAVSGQSKTQ